MEEVVENESSLPDDDIEKLKSLIVLARQYLKNERSEEAWQLFERVKVHQNRLPDNWREGPFKDVETAVQEFDQREQLPEWLFVWPYRRPGYPS